MKSKRFPIWLSSNMDRRYTHETIQIVFYKLKNNGDKFLHFILCMIVVHSDEFDICVAFSVFLNRKLVV